jgi:hypothetical protein
MNRKVGKLKIYCLITKTSAIKDLTVSTDSLFWKTPRSRIPHRSQADSEGLKKVGQLSFFAYLLAIIPTMINCIE